MFSPEFMSYLIKYQSKEYLPEEKFEENEKNSEFDFKIHCFTKFATVPITSKH